MSASDYRVTLTPAHADKLRLIALAEGCSQKEAIGRLIEGYVFSDPRFAQALSALFEVDKGEV